MSEPMVPAAATTPAASGPEYLYLSISGTAMRPIAAAQATEEPVTAENIAAPQIDATPIGTRNSSRTRTAAKPSEPSVSGDMARARFQATISSMTGGGFAGSRPRRSSTALTSRTAAMAAVPIGTSSRLGQVGSATAPISYSPIRNFSTATMPDRHASTAK